MSKALAGRKLSEEHKKKISKSSKNKIISDSHKNNIAKSINLLYNGSKGNEIKEKQRIAAKNQIWICNPQTGTSKRIKKSETIPNGWKRGRK